MAVDQASSESGGLLYNPNFMFSEGEPSMDHKKQQQQQVQNSGLMRYCSAPSSFFANLVGTYAVEDFHAQPVSTDQVDNMSSRFLSSNTSGQPEGRFTKQSGYTDNTQSLYGDLQNDYSAHLGHASRELPVDMNSSAVANMQHKTSGGNCSNLARQSSSPAGFLSNLATDSGFGAFRDFQSNFKAINISYGPSSSSKLMPHMIGTETKNMGAGNFENGNLTSVGGAKRQHVSNFPNDCWDDSACHGHKRAKDNNGKIVSGLNSFEFQDEGYNAHAPTLVHHLSWPKTSGEIATVEKFLSFEVAVPCKMRAKRGFATHPRSIAERVRRTRISERIRKLQELFPDIDKQTNTADMLDMALSYIKNLQKHVETLTYTKEKCTCSRKQNNQ